MYTGTLARDWDALHAQGAAGQVDWRLVLGRVLPYVDVFTPSLEELLYMLAPGELLILKIISLQAIILGQFQVGLSNPDQPGKLIN